MDLLMDTDITSAGYGDLFFVNGACPVTDENRLTVSQRLRIRLLTFLSEWFLDTTYGIPYYEQLLGRKTSKSVVDRIFQTEILKEQGVLEILEFSSTLGGNRQYSMSFRVKTDRNQTTDIITIDGVGI